jgi:hypothetical protein
MYFDAQRFQLGSEWVCRRCRGWGASGDGSLPAVVRNLSHSGDRGPGTSRRAGLSGGAGLGVGRRLGLHTPPAPLAVNRPISVSSNPLVSIAISGVAREICFSCSVSSVLFPRTSRGDAVVGDRKGVGLCLAQMVEEDRLHLAPAEFLWRATEHGRR